MFAYCLNNPISRSDPAGNYSNFSILVSSPECAGQSKKLIDLAFGIGERASISEGAISLDMDQELDVVLYLSEYYGIGYICDAIALAACEKYCEMYGRDFLLSTICVSYEIEEHIYAYLWSKDLRPLPNVLAAGFSMKKILTGRYSASSVYDATRTIDIYEKDVWDNGIGTQAWIFDYRNGIRNCYLGTEWDPWAFER